MERLISVFGLAVFVGLSYAFSVDRRAVKWSPVLWGIALQLIFAILILKTAPGLAVFKFLGDMVYHHTLSLRHFAASCASSGMVDD
jgi:CNT family concentrative nucleoside transporter